MYPDTYVRKLQCVIINKSEDKKTVRNREEELAVDYWAGGVGGTKNNNKHFYTMTHSLDLDLNGLLTRRNFGCIPGMLGTYTIPK